MGIFDYPDGSHNTFLGKFRKFLPTERRVRPPPEGQPATASDAGAVERGTMKLQLVAIRIHAGSLLGVLSSTSCPPAELGLASSID